MKFNQLVDDAVEKFEVARAVNFADLAKQAHLEAQFSQPQSENKIYFNKPFINGKEFTPRRLEWHDLINGNHLKKSLIGTFGYPWYVLKEIAIIWTVFNHLQCLFGLFRSAFNTSNLKSLLRPNITLAKIINSGFFGVFSQPIFHVLQSYSTQYKPPSFKKNNVDILSIVSFHTLKMNWIYYTKCLKTSIRNSLLQYTVIQTNTTFLQYQPTFTNAMKYQWDRTENLILSHLHYTHFNLRSVNVHVVFHTQGTLLRIILIIRKSQKN